MIAKEAFGIIFHLFYDYFLESGTLEDYIIATCWQDVSIYIRIFRENLTCISRLT